MPRPRFSVIINNYNYGSLVGRALDSALAQNEPCTEIIVVDDGSQDGSRSVLDQYRQRVQLIYQDNRGQAGAINAGVAASQGEFICFLDADDWWAPGKLAAVGAAFDANPYAVLVYHRLQPALSDGTLTLRPIPRTLCSGHIATRIARSAGWWPFPMTSAVAVRRSAWDEAGDIPESFRISADAWLVGIYPFLGRVAALPQSLGFYRIHENNWYRKVDDAAMLRRRMSHWLVTVAETNRFLQHRGLPWTLHLADHLPYRSAAARLNGLDVMTLLGLTVRSLCFPGEPNLPRRLRETIRLLSELCRVCLQDRTSADPDPPDATVPGTPRGKLK
jgi:glycosyltransferase involved in cell wall biosynthesis